LTTVALLTLLHVLVLVYWLGGDLGAYYTSRFVYDSATPVPARALAAKVLANVDMAPRTCLILAVAKGWVAFHWIWTAMIVAGFLLWLMIAWTVHVSAHGDKALAAVDLVLRVGVLGALVGTAALALTGGLSLPLFLTGKLLLLAFAILMGLLIRRRLHGFGPAFGRLMSEGPSPSVDAALRGSIEGARPFVLGIWAALVLAAWLGLATPV
jgi:hypothetical protein